MSFHYLRLKFVAILLSVLVCACGGGSSAPPPVGGLTVTPGGGQVTVSWTMTPGVEYWLLYAPVASISTNDLPSGHLWATNITSPYVVSGLVNGTTYSFTLNGRTGGGPGGPGTPSVSAIPRPAGGVWTPGSALGSNTLRGVSFGSTSDSGGNNFVAVGDAGAIFKTTDGSVWTNISPGPAVNLDASLNALGKFLVAGAAGTIYYSGDLAFWGTAASNTSANLHALATNGSLAVAVGDAGTIRYSSDGVTWYAAASVPTTANLYGVAYALDGRWAAVGTGGTLLTSTDGSNWSALNSGTNADLRAIAVQSAFVNIFVAVGSAGTVLRSYDGLNWGVQQIASAPNLTAIVAGLDQLLAVGMSGAAFISTDSGGNWSQQNTGSTADLYGLGGTSVFYVAVGQNGSLITSR